MNFFNTKIFLIYDIYFPNLIFAKYSLYMGYVHMCKQLFCVT